ncbi:MAG: phosphatase PAP2 family protein [bacterium]|nr:phosphatase PAP2 family protein [bacterium]
MAFFKLAAKEHVPSGKGAESFYASCRAVCIIALVLGIIGEIAQHFGFGRTGYKFELSQVGYDMFVTSGFLCVALCYNRLATSLKEQGIVAALCVTAELFLYSVRPESWSVWDRLECAGIGIGAVSFAAIAFHAVFGDPERRHAARGYLWTAGFLTVFSSVTLWGHFMVLELTPKLYDLYAIEIDSLWGCLPGLAVARFFYSNLYLFGITELIYMQLPLILMIAVFAASDNHEKCYNSVIASFTGMGVAGFFLYHIYPAVGLGYLTNNFPWCNPAELFGTTPYLIEKWGIRNCLPSLHLAWILCMYFGVKRISAKANYTALAFVIITALATLMMCHYVIDLVASFPLVLAFQAITARSASGSGRTRLTVLLIACFILFGGLMLLRFGHSLIVACPPAAIAGQILVVCLCVWLEDVLARAVMGGNCQQGADSAAEI